MSAWITFFKTHYTTLMRLFGHLRTPQNQDLFDEYTKYLTNIMQSLDPVLSLLELTVSYKALFQATAQLLDELHTWRQSRPAAIRLSEAYLNSIGYYNNRE